MVEGRVEAEQTKEASREAERDDEAAAFLLEDIRRRASLPSDITPEDALGAVMCTFSQHVSGGMARHMWDALPERIKPLLERCMVHREEKAARFSKDELFTRVAQHLEVSVERAAEITRAVLTVIDARLPADEVEDVTSQLPRSLRDLWNVMKVPLAPPVEPHPVLSRIERAVTLPPHVTGMGAFTSVVGNLSRRLSLGEARRLLDGLPSDLRQLVEPRLHGRGERGEHFDKTRFLERVARDLDIDDLALAETVAREVFHDMGEYVSASVFEHVMTQLPRDLSDVWALPERP